MVEKSSPPPPPTTTTHHHQQVLNGENHRTTRDCCSTKPTVKQSKRNYPAAGEAEDHQIKCSGKSCKSYTASLLADCVAICCCPCAVINLLTLTLVKAPWMVGRRCLVLAKKKCRNKLDQKKGRRRNKKKEDQPQQKPEAAAAEEEEDEEKGKIEMKKNMDEDVEMKKVMEMEESFELPIEMLQGLGGNGEHFCARVEAERVWLEFYQVGHLGFGRVSFTGIPPKG